MARARNIKPGFFANEFLADLPYEARLLFIGLWTLADRRGRLEDRPKGIKGKLFPFDELDGDILLQQLVDSPGGFIVRYEAEGKKYIQITNFEKHQNPHCRETESEIPPPPVKAQDKHGACTVLESGWHDTSPADSPLLIPDCPIPHTLPPEEGGQAPVSNKRGTVQKRFVPPTLEEVATYCRERGNNVDPRKFYDYFQAGGWKDSKGNPVKNWKQKVITWEGHSGKVLPKQPVQQIHKQEPSVCLSDLIEYPSGSGKYRPKWEVPPDA